MLDMKTFKQSLPYSAGALAYIAVVATAMQNAERILGADKPDGVLAPIGFLLLFVVSAATMGMLVFGKPIMLYLDGKKREGAMMAVYTIAQMAMFTLLLFVAMAARA